MNLDQHCRCKKQASKQTEKKEASDSRLFSRQYFALPLTTNLMLELPNVGLCNLALSGNAGYATHIKNLVIWAIISSKLCYIYSVIVIILWNNCHLTYRIIFCLTLIKGDNNIP